MSSCLSKNCSDHLKIVFNLICCFSGCYDEGSEVVDHCANIILCDAYLYNFFISIEPKFNRTEVTSTMIIIMVYLETTINFENLQSTFTVCMCIFVLFHCLTFLKVVK